MSAQEKDKPAADPLAVTEDEIDAVIYEAKGDPREAIRSLLRDLAVMALDADAATSGGYLRGRFSARWCRAPYIEEA